MNSGNTRPHPPLEEVMNIEEIFFDAQAEIALFGTKNSKFQETVVFICKIQVPALLIFDTDAGPIFISKSIVTSSRRNCIPRLNVPRLQAATKQQLELEEVVLLHVRIEDPEVLVWSGVLNELAGDRLVRTSFINRFVRGIHLFSRTITLWKSTPMYSSAIRSDSEKTAN